MVSLFFVVSGTGQMLCGLSGGQGGRAARDVRGAQQLCGGGAGGCRGAELRHAAGGFFLCGLGQCAVSPVDFTILNKRVTAKNIGHAFSVHSISGNIGWATAPVFMLGITTATGSWRMACACGALFAALVLRHHRGATAAGWMTRPLTALQRPKPRRQPVRPMPDPFAYLKLPAVWMCFAFFLQHRGLERHSELPPARPCT